jgi:hypothetical protein
MFQFHLDKIKYLREKKLKILTCLKTILQNYGFYVGFFTKFNHDFKSYQTMVKIGCSQNRLVMFYTNVIKII